MRGTLTAKVEGVTHNIPESWLAGFCRAQGGLPAATAEEAVRWWHQQWKLERDAAHASPPTTRSSHSP